MSNITTNSLYVLQGKESFTEGFRVLIAGGGTGNAVTFLAEQLRHTGAEVSSEPGSQAPTEYSSTHRNL